MITAPSTVSTTPSARFKVFAEALLAKTAATRAKNSVLSMQSARTSRSGIPPMIKMTGGAGQCSKGHDKDACADGCLQLVAKYGGEDQQHHHAAACTDKAADQPDHGTAEHGLDDSGFLVDGHAIFSFVVITGRTMNLIPSSSRHNGREPAHCIAGE